MKADFIIYENQSFDAEAFAENRMKQHLGKENYEKYKELAQQGKADEIPEYYFFTTPRAYFTRKYTK